MPQTMKGEFFTDIAKSMQGKLNPGSNYQNTFMAEEAIGNEGTGIDQDEAQGTEYSAKASGNSGESVTDYMKSDK